MKWAERELKILRDRDLTHAELHTLLPNRSIDGIRRKTYQLGLQRTLRRFGHITPEEAACIWSNPVFQQTIEGHLLGDGCIDKEGSSFRLGTSNEDYAIYTQNALNKLSKKKSKMTYHPPVTKMWKTGKFISRESWSINCACCQIFRPQRARWYPNGTKSIPTDFELTPLACNRWYCDDGYLTIYPKNHIYTVTLCTDGFTISEIKFLRNQISEKIDIETGTRKMHGKFLRIVIYTEMRVHKFLDYIGSYPVDSFAYKWNAE